MNRYLAIAIGGVIGASTRWLIISISWPTTGFPWAIFVVNVLGCGLLGLLMAEEWSHPKLRLWLHDFGGIGFCGGMTTMSTFSLDVVRLHDSEGLSMSILYGTSNVVVGIGTFVLAAALLRRVSALRLPLEQQP